MGRTTPAHGGCVFFGGLLLSLICGGAPALAGDVVFTIHSARDGNWSDPATWAEHRVPAAGDTVQVRPGNIVTYDVQSDAVIRTIHVAGTLRFARDRSTRLTVGLIKIQPGDAMTEDGFNCDDHPAPAATASGAEANAAALEIGTLEQPMPAEFTATIRLAYINGMSAETCPAIVDCGGRWDVHGSPMNHTWVKLGDDVPADGDSVPLAEPVQGWRVGDHVIVTSSKLDDEVGGGSFAGENAKSVQTEEATIAGISRDRIVLTKPLRFAHRGTGVMRSEIADLSRNVIIESADPGGVRGHTMYHIGSSGSISYAEFRHLGKQGVLGKYSIHFHLCRDSMRGSGVVGASIWDSANRWVTIHGTDHLLVRDCVGFGSIGHGFFLEDGTEAYNVLQGNLAVHAYRGKPLPKQALSFDSNDGAGFWWAAGRNTLVDNVSCENDQYGYHFDQSDSRERDFRRPLEMPEGSYANVDIRTVPFYRFEGNESHCDGLYSFNFGIDRNGIVHGDKRHPFICQNLLSWETHYAMRPTIQYFLLDGMQMIESEYGIYHPGYDAQVYRNLYLNHVMSEPINRGLDDDDIQYGDFTYDHLKLENCSGTLIQLTSTAPRPGVTGHFRNVIVTDVNKYPRDRATVDLGTGPLNDMLQNPVVYYFHDLLKPGEAVKVVSRQYPLPDPPGSYQDIPGFTGPRVKTTSVTGVEFPTLLDPVDDLPPATMIRSVRKDGDRLLVTGVTTDNDTVASVSVNGTPATITRNVHGVADWTASIIPNVDGTVTASGTDAAGNVETHGHRLSGQFAR